MKRSAYRVLFSLFVLLLALTALAKVTPKACPPIGLPRGEMAERAFVGNFGESVVLIGSSKVYRLSEDSRWTDVGTLSSAFCARAAVSTDAGVFCIGEADGRGVCRLVREQTKCAWSDTALPTCPVGMGRVVCAARDRVVFVVDGDSARSAVWRLDLAENDGKWQALPPLPGTGVPVAAAVQNGEHQQVNLYVFSVDESRRISVASLPVGAGMGSGRAWTEMPEASTSEFGGEVTAVASGSQHVLVFGEKGVLAYHTITRKWFVPPGTSGFEVSGCTSMARGKGSSFIAVQKSQEKGGGTCRRFVFRRERTLHPLNTAVIALFFVGMAALGVYFMRRNKSSDDYFRAGGRLPWWAVSLSIYATMFSSITFLSIPALAYATDCRYAGLEIGILVLAPLVARYYLPFFRRLNLTSAYEYLEVRFNLVCRLFASGAFCLFMVARTAVVTYLPAVALAAVMDVDVNVAIVIVTVVTILYCTLGGIEAVVWSDCIQSLILIVSTAIILCWLVFGTDGGVGGFLTTGAAAEKFKFLDFALDWSQPTFWVVLVGGIVANLASYTSDQCVVQRYMTTKDEVGAAKSIMTNGVLSFVNALVFFVIGVALFTFFHSHPEALDVTMPQNDSIFPLFIADSLPPGLSGLILAAIAAATMSTLSTNLNSAATAVTTDFYARLVPGADERGKMRCGRLTTVATGILGGAVALALANMDVQAIYDQFQRFLGILTAGLGCLFLMGVFMPRIKGKAAFAGLVANYAVCIGLDSWSSSGKPHLLLYGFFGVVACLTVAGLASLGGESEMRDANGSGKEEGR